MLHLSVQSPSIIAREEFEIFAEADTSVDGLTIILPSGARMTNTTVRHTHTHTHTQSYSFSFI